MHVWPINVLVNSTRHLIALDDNKLLFQVLCILRKCVGFNDVLILNAEVFSHMFKSFSEAVRAWCLFIFTHFNDNLQHRLLLIFQTSGSILLFTIFARPLRIPILILVDLVRVISKLTPFSSGGRLSHHVTLTLKQRCLLSSYTRC